MQWSLVCVYRFLFTHRMARATNKARHQIILFMEKKKIQRLTRTWTPSINLTVIMYLMRLLFLIFFLSQHFMHCLLLLMLLHQDCMTVISIYWHFNSDMSPIRPTNNNNHKFIISQHTTTYTLSTFRFVFSVLIRIYAGDLHIHSSVSCIFPLLFMIYFICGHLQTSSRL